MPGPDAVLTLNAGSSSIKAALFTGAGVAAGVQAGIEGVGERRSSRPTTADGDALAGGAGTARRCPQVIDSPSSIWAANASRRSATASSMAAARRAGAGGRRLAGRVGQAGALGAAASAAEPGRDPGGGARTGPDLPQVACFDTAFHHTLDPLAARFPIPARAARCRAAALRLPRPVLRVHRRPAAGSGARPVAGDRGASRQRRQPVRAADGRSVDTTMGLTPLDGLMMGTRCGAVDPGLVLALLQDHDGRA